MKKLYSLILLSLFLVSLLASIVNADVSTVSSFALSFASGESFNVQDEYRLTTYTFTVTSGTLAGSGTLTLASASGSLVIASTSTCAFTVSGYNPSTTVYTDGSIYASGSVINLVAGQSITISWKGVSTVIVGGGEIADMYFRSDTFTSLGVEAYGLDSDYTNVYTSINSSISGAATVAYGYRVWLVDSATVSTELTDGTPIGIVNLVSDAVGYQTSTWSFEGHAVTFGYQALEIVVYESDNSGAWVAKASYISNVLLTEYLQPSTWTFQLYVSYNNDASTTTSAFTFGSSNYRSGLYNFVYTKALESTLQWWRLTHGDLIGFLLGGYVDLMGEAFYAFIIFGVAASMYRRYGHFGPIAFFFTVFGGVGGIVWLFVPLWAAVVVATFVILGTTFVVWRIIR